MHQANGQDPENMEQAPETPRDGPATLESLSGQVRGLVKNQLTLMTLVQRNTDHVLELKKTVDPLTAKRRAVLIFSGAVAGSGMVALLLRVGAALAAGH